MYQGHLPDGSSVQTHSAGPLYPFVLYFQDINAPRWGYISPNGHEAAATMSYAECVELVTRLKRDRDAAALAAQFKAGRDWATKFARVDAPDTLSGDPLDEPLSTLKQQQDAYWSARRDCDLWYQGLIDAGLTTDEEMNRLQRCLADAARGFPMASVDRNRYNTLRTMARLGAAQ